MSDNTEESEQSNSDMRERPAGDRDLSAAIEEDEARIEPIELPGQLIEEPVGVPTNKAPAPAPNLMTTLTQLAPLIQAFAPLLMNRDPIGSAVSNQINAKIGEGLSQAIANSIRISFDPNAFATGFNAAKPVEAKGFYNESDYL